MAQLAFGYSKGVPADATRAWGARLLADQTGTVQMLGDRQAMWAKDLTEEQAWDERVTGDLLDFVRANLDAAFARAREALKGYEMSTREARYFVLYEDETGLICGNTNASAGYLYVAAFLKADVPALNQDAA